MTALVILLVLALLFGIGGVVKAAWWALVIALALVVAGVVVGRGSSGP